MLDTLSGKGLLIHHWDTDGICSATLLLKHLKNKDMTNRTPILGNYFLTDEEIKNYQHYDYIIIADMSLPKENILALSKKAKVAIFDHHLGPVIEEVFHHNPIIKGENPDEYPSASWIVNTYLNNEVNLFAILGVLGDHEQKIQKNPILTPIIDEYCKNHNLTFDQLLEMVYLIDSNYKMGKKEDIEQIPHFFQTITDHNDILNHPQWKDNVASINEEITKQLQQPTEELNGVLFKKIHTKYSIISTITRKVAWDSGKTTMVLNTGFFDDMNELYVRSTTINLEPLIQKGKQRGYKCGGKKEVLGSIIPKTETDSFIEEIKDYLNKI